MGGCRCLAAASDRLTILLPANAHCSIRSSVACRGGSERFGQERDRMPSDCPGGASGRRRYFAGSRYRRRMVPFRLPPSSMSSIDRYAFSGSATKFQLICATTNGRERPKAERWSHDDSPMAWYYTQPQQERQIEASVTHGDLARRTMLTAYSKSRIMRRNRTSRISHRLSCSRMIWPAFDLAGLSAVRAG